MKTCWNLLIAAVLCFGFTSCDKGDDPQSTDLLIGEWKAVAAEGWTKEEGILTDSWIWKTGDSEMGTQLLPDWWTFNRNATGVNRFGKFTWSCVGSVFNVATESTGSGGGAVVLDYNMPKLSGSSLVLDLQIQHPMTGEVTYEKVTYGRK